MNRIYLLSSFVFASLAVALGGCGGGENVKGLVAAGGTVTQGGQPVEGASVIFMGAGGYTSFGATDAQGKYTLSTRNQKGAAPATYKVLITKLSGGPSGPIPVPGSELTPGNSASPTATGPAPPAAQETAKNTLNPKYGTKETTPFEKVIDKDPAKNVFDFNLDP